MLKYLFYLQILKT